MPDNEWNTILAEAAGEVLETMFFTSVCGPAEPTSGPSLAVRLNFKGTPSGALTLRVSEPAARALAGNFLPSEDEEPPLSELGGVVCELANMICGSMLSRVQTEEHFQLASPELLAEGVPALPPNQSLAMGETPADGTIDLWLVLEPHAD